MRAALAILVAFFVVGCESSHKEAPPGFDILCDGKGHYIAEYSNTHTRLRGYSINNLNPFTWDNNDWSNSKQRAINEAWAQYEFEHHDEIINRQFHPCSK
jgi:hypothetical protein